MRMPGFTAEKALGRAVHQYRAAAGAGAADRQSVQAAVIGGGGRSCRDCDGSYFTCPPGTYCVRLCTRTGGYAYCEGSWGYPPAV